MKRVFLIVLDSFGMGALPDAASYGDAGSNTLAAVCAAGAQMPFLRELGLFNIQGASGRGPAAAPRGAFGRMAERSKGKDTTTGHWELAGVVSEKGFPTFPDGFGQELLDEFSRRTGRGVLCNKPYSGTQVIVDYGREHLQTGALIVYTSADSVFQVAAHEAVVPVEELYEDCRIARQLLTGENGVGRVIARPFEGEYPHFVRTARRHDFSLPPTGTTALDCLQQAGREVIAVGKISDIFAGRGITRAVPTSGNRDGMQKVLELAKEDFQGLCFANLVDFDMLYGHRNDPAGYARALDEADGLLRALFMQLGPEDVLVVTADHGCDPSTGSTDHSREYVPVLAAGPRVRPGVDLGTRETFADLGETVLQWLGLPPLGVGASFTGEVGAPFALTEGLCRQLAGQALQARQAAYAPYSRFAVGAALLSRGGRVFTGCNVEAVAYPAGCCAERAALVKAVSEGERDFVALAVAGGPLGAGEELEGFAAPCGMCRQALAEFCPPEMPVIMAKGPQAYQVAELGQLLPLAFGAGALPPR